jgi:hypothetical protein
LEHHAPSVARLSLYLANLFNQAGGSGLDGRLDTIFLPPDTQLTVPVTATSGTTLHYMCAIHAWMQGTINVKG